MKHVCHDDMSGFDRLLHLPETHPDRTAVEDCPRCASRFLAFRTFLEGRDIAGADPVEAEKHLSEYVTAQAAAHLGPAPAESEGWWTRLRRVLSAPRVVMPTLVAVTLIAIGVWRWQPWVDRSLEVRSTGVPHTSAVMILSVGAAADGSVDIAWEPVESADAYAIRLLRADFTEIHRLGPVTVTTLSIAASESPDGVRYWQVVALKGGDEIAASPIREMPRLR